MKYKNYMYSCKFFWPPRLGSESRLRIRITQQTQIKNKNQLCEFGSAILELQSYKRAQDPDSSSSGMDLRIRIKTLQSATLLF
jgi:hypothetical protein